MEALLRAIALIDGRLRIEPRDQLPLRPDGWLLQAGPLLVREGVSAIAGVEDPEGFSASCHEFDEDLTASREPRLALWELADLLVSCRPTVRSTSTADRPPPWSPAASGSTRREATKARTSTTPR